MSRLTLVSASVIAEAEADEGLPTLSRGELEGIDKETVMVEKNTFCKHVFYVSFPIFFPSAVYPTFNFSSIYLGLFGTSLNSVLPLIYF